MPTQPMGPMPKIKPVLPSPTFKYGERSYIALAYAKVKNKEPFTIEGLLAFSGRFSKPSDAKRAIDTLLRNESIREVSEGLWTITNKGRQHILDFAARRKLTSQGPN
jgi:hypothetical protein